MRKPPMTFDAIFAALAVLSTTAACSKADRAAAEPPVATPAATATSSAIAPAAEPPAPPQAAPTAAGSSGSTDEGMKNAAAVDAGTERTKIRAKPGGGSASCGATGCSAEMRKGGK